jgi:sucrose-6-phosphate hydrolase SacC (GH32 family)
LAVFDRDNGTLDLHIYVDRATVEVFAKSGAVYFLEGRKKPGAPLEDLKVTVEGGSTTIASLKAFRLKSIWRQK